MLPSPISLMAIPILQLGERVGIDRAHLRASCEIASHCASDSSSPRGPSASRERTRNLISSGLNMHYEAAPGPTFKPNPMSADMPCGRLPDGQESRLVVSRPPILLYRRTASPASNRHQHDAEYRALSAEGALPTGRAKRRFNTCIGHILGVEPPHG